MAGGKSGNIQVLVNKATEFTHQEACWAILVDKPQA